MTSPALTNPFERYKHIVVEGPIGVGKTSLARKLSERFHAEQVLEQPEENPFLERFYKDGRRYALPTQLFFLFQRVNQLRELSQRDLFSKPVVGDFLLDKDHLFASLTLDNDELKLYRNILEHLRPQVPTPDLVIYLQANAERLEARVRRRGLAMESSITGSYLGGLSDAYTRFFYQYEAAPLLIINTEHLNPIDREADFEMLIKHILELKGRRSFFNVAQGLLKDS
jgi:deoxyguanosine kinase